VVSQASWSGSSGHAARAKGVASRACGCGGQPEQVLSPGFDLRRTEQPVDLMHYHCQIHYRRGVPSVWTSHGNMAGGAADSRTICVSQDHARRTAPGVRPNGVRLTSTNSRQRRRIRPHRVDHLLTRSHSMSAVTTLSRPFRRVSRPPCGHAVTGWQGAPPWRRTSRQPICPRKRASTHPRATARGAERLPAVDEAFQLVAVADGRQTALEWTVHEGIPYKIASRSLPAQGWQLGAPTCRRKSRTTSTSASKRSITTTSSRRARRAQRGRRRRVPVDVTYKAAQTLVSVIRRYQELQVSLPAGGALCCWRGSSGSSTASTTADGA